MEALQKSEQVNVTETIENLSVILNNQQMKTQSISDMVSTVGHLLEEIHTGLKICYEMLRTNIDTNNKDEQDPSLLCFYSIFLSKPNFFLQIMRKIWNLLK